jgi:hypothetical protein
MKTTEQPYLISHRIRPYPLVFSLSGALIVVGAVARLFGL